MKLKIITFALLLVGFSATAQKNKTEEKPLKTRISAKDLTKLTLMEDSMRLPAMTMLLDTLTTDSTATRGDSQAKLDTLSQEWRIAAGNQLVGMVRRALRVKHSFDYNFEKVPQISIVYPKNRSFRVMTWQVFANSMDFRYSGVVQFENGKTIFLQDKKKTIRNAKTKKLKTDNWYGALYYKLKEYKVKGKVYYMLLGYDADAFCNHSKIAEPLNIEGTSVSFGAPVFDLRTQEEKLRDEEIAKRQAKSPINYIKPEPPHRFILDYAGEAAVSLRYDEEMGLFTFDHVVPMGNTKCGMKFIPDGDVDGLKLVSGKWVLQERLFKDVMEEVPRPVPILDGKKESITRRPDGFMPSDNKEAKP